jgi:hypothetical protein
MEPHLQHLQNQLNSALSPLTQALLLHDEIEGRRMQQITTLEEALCQLKQENLYLKGELGKLSQKLSQQEPLLKVGVHIRRRFLEIAKVKRGFGNAAESIIEAGNAAAHRGDIFADAALFKLGILRSVDPVFT